MRPVPAVWWRRFHATMTALWLVAIIPSLLWWSHSLAWIVLMSVWANVAGHFSGWQGSRAEASNNDTADNPISAETSTERGVPCARCHGK